MGALQLTYEPKFKIVHRTGELMRSHEAKSVQLWLSTDPLAERYSRITPYAYTANNPIFFLDPDGMRIRNLAQEKADNMEERHSQNLERRDRKAEYLGISANSSTRAWKKAVEKKGGESELNETLKVLDFCSKSEKTLSKLKEEAELTENRISELKENSPNMFKIMDGLDVDVLMQVDSSLDDNGLSSFNGGYDENGNFAFVTKEGISNAIVVKLGLTMGQYDGKGTVPTTLQATKHEMGHTFVYITQTTEYLKYLDDIGGPQKAQGGHRWDDPSGQKAHEWQNIDDNELK